MKLHIARKANSPEVILDPDNNTYLIAGWSHPDNVHEFYDPVMNWLDEFGIKHLSRHMGVSPYKLLK